MSVKIRPHVAITYLAITGCLVNFLGSVSFWSGNPDTRSSFEVAQAWHKGRGDKNVSEGREKSIAKEAEEILLKMGMPPGTDSDEVWDLTEVGKTAEEQKNKGTKYLFRSNLHGYVSEHRLIYAANVIEYNRKQKKNRNAWLTMDTQEFLLSSLAAVQDVSGKDMVDAQERPCLFLAPLAEEITRVNREMFEKENVEIKFTVCWRNNLHQAVAFASITGGSNLAKERSGIKRPGNSHHGMGLAADISNWRIAAKYLATIGMVGGCGNGIDGDAGHVSYGEQGVAKNLLGSLRRSFVAAKCAFN